MTNIGKNILYICLKLDGRSKVKLIETLDEYFGDYQYEKTFCDHLTLAFGREILDFDEGLIGQKATVSSNVISFDNKCIALVVDREQVKEMGVHNEHPHITLATTIDTKPVYSNTMLQSDHDEIELDEPVELSGTIEAIRR